MAVRKTGLGKGLDSLIPAAPIKSDGNGNTKKKSPDKVKEKKNSGTEESNKNESKPEVIVKEVIKEVIKEAETNVKISLIEPNRDQPRKAFEEDALLELADSIKQFGVLQPLIVQKKDDYYEIIAGERRWRAAKLAGLKEVPVIIKDFSDLEVVEISLIENIQRENLNPIEEAQAYKRLLDEFNLKQDEIAEKVSKSRTAITNSMRLLKLDERVQQMVIEEMISTGHARALLGIEDKEQQYVLAMNIFDGKLSVRETEKLVKSITNPATKKNEENVIDSARAAVYENLQEKMKNILGTKVYINPKSKNKGKIEIEYYSDQELERITDLLQSIQI